ncbi:MAG TPA: hypothetical protein VGO96_05795 [Pyrinomonadaceae bacterium]|jgi:hypothetical protein|nr:hypothetical protein [Pyrinomonadaceae bacterium]
MTEQTAGKWNKLALALGIIACVLALSAALVRYVRSGEVDVTKIAAGVFIAAVIYALTRQSSSRKE